MVAHCALVNINSIPHWAAEKQFLAPRIPRPQLPVQADTQCNMEKGLQGYQNDTDSEVIVVWLGKKGHKGRIFLGRTASFLKRMSSGPQNILISIIFASNPGKFLS